MLQNGTGRYSFCWDEMKSWAETTEVSVFADSLGVSCQQTCITYTIVVCTVKNS